MRCLLRLSGLWGVLLTILASCSPPAAYAIDVKTYIPKNAYPLFPVVNQEWKTYYPTIPIPHYLGGLIEQESCVSLTNSRCWSSTSELKTSREQGVGLGQITRTFNVDGSVKSDSLMGVKRQFPKELGNWSWDNVRSRPDLQVRAIVLMIKDGTAHYGRVKDKTIALQFSDSAYNGGPGMLDKERMACGMKKTCNPDLWFGNVEKICVRSTKSIYGANRSPCSINREHVSNIFYLRMLKYKPYLK